MKLLLIADKAPEDIPDIPKYVSDNNIDAVITAGDLYGSVLRGISDCAIPALGVYGNHDSGTYLDSLGMTNLHRTKTTINGVTFVGIEGCVRYKASQHAIMYSQDEYAALIADLPPADVLVTHCPPRGINDHTDPAHVGIDALRDWIDQHHPRIAIHGHTYPQHPTTHYGRTQIVYVHGARTLNLQANQP